MGLAGRTAWGLGKRLGGRPAELVASEIQHRTADQIFRVLGELKGGAMKFGQALSIFEAALPPEIAGPYRATLTKLQESAPPLPASTVHRVLAEDLGPDWREAFAEFNDKPAAAASIGQVHRARWRDGREVAVKIQYPGAGRALLSDFNQLSRVARLFAVLMPGLEVRPLLDELRARVAEELDYHLEAESQHAFAVAYAGDPDIFVPDVVAGTSHVLITEWMDGTPLSKIISDGSQEERDRAGLLFARFLFSGPARAGLLHADPHPGNFRLLADGRLGVLDFGAVDRLPDGLPPFIGRLLRIVHDGADLGPAEQELREQGFLRDGIEFEPGGAAGLPGAAGGTLPGGKVQVQPGVAAGRGHPGGRSACRQHEPAAQSAPLIRAHPPGLDRRHGGAVPARKRRAVPGGDAQVDARLLGHRPASRGAHRGCGERRLGGLGPGKPDPRRAGRRERSPR